MVVALLGKAAEGAHGLPHDGMLHPLGEMLGIEVFTVLEEFWPRFGVCFDLRDMEFAQLEEPDGAVVDEPAPQVVTQIAARRMR